MTESSQIQFLELIRAGLWCDTPDITLFNQGIDWQQVISLASKQFVCGIIFPSIEKLPSNMQPQRNDMLRLHQIITLNRKRYSHHTEVLAKIIDLVKSQGVTKPVLLKGLGLGINYPDPSCRQCGDIDLYVGERYYYQIFKLLCNQGLIKDAEVINKISHHFEVEFLNTPIEIHKHSAHIKNILFRANDFIKWSDEQLTGENLIKTQLGSAEVFLPDHNFNFVFIANHIWHHFITGGVGLRQFCDWCLFINKHSHELDAEKITQIIHSFRLEKPMALISTIAVRALGLDKQKLPFYKEVDSKLYQDVLGLILTNGNFGFYNPKILERRDKPFLVRKFLGTKAAYRELMLGLRIDTRFALKYHRISMLKRINTFFKELAQIITK